MLVDYVKAKNQQRGLLYSISRDAKRRLVDFTAY